MSQISFSDLKLLPAIQKSLDESGYVNPTPIQAKAIPLVLAGQDILGIAQTGTGKTAAFSLPLLQNLMLSKKARQPKSPRALILTPTRELAIQIHQSLVTYGKHLPLKHAVIFGGVGQGLQVKTLQAGVDVLVATPGRLIDLIGQKFLRLDQVETFVLDEADQMLDMGFMPDIRRILPMLPGKTHNLLFSATMPSDIQKLADGILKKPQKIEVAPAATTAEKIEQSVMFVEKSKKFDLLLHLLKNNNLYKVLVFVQMKHAADRVVDKLTKSGVAAAAIHGNRSQNARQRALEEFRTGKIRVLVATDIAARGIDIDGITHVINFELSHLPETYVHRIGRTARAGQEGQSIAFCNAEEKAFLVAIERTTRQAIKVITNHPYHSDEIANSRALSVGKAKAAIESRVKQESRDHQAKIRQERRHQRPSGGGGGRNNRGQSQRSGSARSADDQRGPRKEREQRGESQAQGRSEKPAIKHFKSSPSAKSENSSASQPPKKRRFFGFGRKNT